MAIGYEALRSAVVENGLSGGVIALHSSLKSFGLVEGGADTVIRAFLEENSTLLVPAFFYASVIRPPFDRQYAQNGIDYGKLPDESSGAVVPYQPLPDFIVRDMGAIPAAVLNMAGSVRGDHPVCSFAAIGPQAERLIENQTCMDVYAPYRRMLLADNAFLVLAGVNLTKATPIHFAEQLSGRRLFRAWAKTFDGQIRETEVGGCSDGFNLLGLSLRDLESRVRVGESLWRIFPFKAFVERAAAVIRDNPSITHCVDPDCRRCNDAVKGGPLIPLE